MRTVWKFPIPIGGDAAAVHSIPDGARFLSCAEQHGQVALWYEIPDARARTSSHRFELFGTGHSIPDHLTYLGTSLHYGGALVLHVYEEPA